MALEIGGGITLGGGISLTVESGGGGGGGGGNLGSVTVTTSSYNDGMSTGTLYGASAMTGTMIDPFGTLTGAALRIYYFSPYGGSTQLFFTDGTYSGFTVVNGAINGDTTNSQTFTIGGVSATLIVQSSGPSSYRYFAAGTDSFNLQSKVGQTLAIDVTI